MNIDKEVINSLVLKVIQPDSVHRFCLAGQQHGGDFVVFKGKNHISTLSSETNQ